MRERASSGSAPKSIQGSVSPEHRVAYVACSGRGSPWSRRRVERRPGIAHSGPGKAGAAPHSGGMSRVPLVATAVAVIVLLAVFVLILTKLGQSSTPSTAGGNGVQVLTPAVPTAQTSLVLTPLAGSPLTELRTYGSGMLLQPQDALRLKNGGVAVADTGHHRVVLLTSSGKLATAITQGARSLAVAVQLGAHARQSTSGAGQRSRTDRRVHHPWQVGRLPRAWRCS